MGFVLSDLKTSGLLFNDTTVILQKTGQPCFTFVERRPEERICQFEPESCPEDIKRKYSVFKRFDEFLASAETGKTSALQVRGSSSESQGFIYLKRWRKKDNTNLFCLSNGVI